MHNPAMGDIVVAGLQELKSFFGTYEQDVSRLWNVFLRL